MHAETTGDRKQDPSDEDPGKRDHLKVTVFAPRHAKGKKFDWAPDLTVAAAAAEAATEFAYAPGNFSLEKGNVVLDRGLTLTAVGIQDKDELGLVDTGGGV